MFNWKEFKEGKIAVHCDTEEKANDFLKKCEEEEIKWNSGRKTTDTNYYEIHQSQTYYEHSNNSFGYCGLDFALKERFKIHDWEIKEKKKMKYKVGDRVKVKKNLAVNTRYGNNIFIKEMGKDKFITIKEYCGNQYKVRENCYLYTDEMLNGLATDYPEIYITTDGKTTTATKTLNGEVVKTAAARCCPEDKFNFEIGAKLALERLNFVPHLEYLFGEHCGDIGEKTEQTAIFGENLYVGDVVELYDAASNEIYENRIVAKYNDNGFIMGFRGFNFKNGISENWQIRKVKSFKDLKDREIIDGIKAVLK